MLIEYGRESVMYIIYFYYVPNKMLHGCFFTIILWWVDDQNQTEYLIGTQSNGPLPASNNLLL